MSHCPCCGAPLKTLCRQTEEAGGVKIVATDYECNGCESYWRAVYDSFEQETTMKRVDRAKVGM